MTKTEIPLLQGIDEICDRWKLTEKQFYMFVELGMPARKVQGRWYAHHQNVDEWFRLLLRVKLPARGNRDQDAT